MKDTYIAKDTDVVRNDIVIARTPHNDDARRIAAALNRFELIPTEAIEAMPQAGVAGLVVEHANLTRLVEEIENISNGSIEDWMKLRITIANAVAQRDQRQSTTTVH